MGQRSNTESVDREKAEKLILYVCHKMEDCHGFGAIVLNKALYYIDHVNYLQEGRKLTGFKYIKQRRGRLRSRLSFCQSANEC